ncbi:hypothetical protein C8R46DRAFT_1065671 [Mycena filopes]|nr:hypothetical protein C8R46DRAFT_1065671 [Mycena filopes]
MSFALTYGSFGDIVETARLAKCIIDVLRSGQASQERQRVISVLKEMHNDVVALLNDLDWDSPSPHLHHILDRLSTELTSCRLLLEKLFTKTNQSHSIMGRILMAFSQERDLICWRAEISERHNALHLLVGSLNSVLSHENGERLGQVNSQLVSVQSDMQTVRSHVQNIGAEVRNFRALAVLGLAASHLLTQRVSDFGSQLQQAHQLPSPRDLSDPVFFVTDPVGQTITIQLAYCNSFTALDRLLKAYLHDRPEAGSQYVERGDYNVVSHNGTIIHPSNFAARLTAEKHLEISIIKRRRDRRKPRPERCPQCDHINKSARNNTWVHCSTSSCGQKYQVSMKDQAGVIEEIFSPQIWQENQKECFRLIQIEVTYLVSSQQLVPFFLNTTHIMAHTPIGVCEYSETF